MFSPSDNYINADRPKFDFVRLILERDVRVANHAACFPVPGVYSPLCLCFVLLSLFFVVKEILLNQLFRSASTVAIAPFHS